MITNNIIIHFNIYVTYQIFEIKSFDPTLHFVF